MLARAARSPGSEETAAFGVGKFIGIVIIGEVRP
jgi:hypothetical protein